MSQITPPSTIEAAFTDLQIKLDGEPEKIVAKEMSRDFNWSFFYFVINQAYNTNNGFKLERTTVLGKLIWRFAI